MRGLEDYSGAAPKPRTIVEATTYRCGCLTAYTTARLLVEAAFCRKGMRIEQARRRASGKLRGLEFEDPRLPGLIAKAEGHEKDLDEHRVLAGVARAGFRPYDPANAAGGPLPHPAEKANARGGDREATDSPAS